MVAVPRVGTTVAHSSLALPCFGLYAVDSDTQCTQCIILSVCHDERRSVSVSVQIFWCRICVIVLERPKLNSSLCVILVLSQEAEPCWLQLWQDLIYSNQDLFYTWCFQVNTINGNLLYHLVTVKWMILRSCLLRCNCVCIHLQKGGAQSAIWNLDLSCTNAYVFRPKTVKSLGIPSKLLSCPDLTLNRHRDHGVNPLLSIVIRLTVYVGMSRLDN